jgi:hypothetical protein
MKDFWKRWRVNVWASAVRELRKRNRVVQILNEFRAMNSNPADLDEVALVRR